MFAGIVHAWKTSKGLNQIYLSESCIDHVISISCKNEFLIGEGKDVGVILSCSHINEHGLYV